MRSTDAVVIFEADWGGQIRYPMNDGFGGSLIGSSRRPSRPIPSREGERGRSDTNVRGASAATAPSRASMRRGNANLLDHVS